MPAESQSPMPMLLTKRQTIWRITYTPSVDQSRPAWLASVDISCSTFAPITQNEVGIKQHFFILLMHGLIDRPRVVMVSLCVIEKMVFAAHFILRNWSKC